MKVIKTIEEMRKWVRGAKEKWKTIGFVPTMGALHLGHVSLMKKAVQQNQATVVSIFVNPIQFGPTEDYEKYPRPWEKDLAIAEESGADVVFAPEVSELLGDVMYTYVHVEKLQDFLCGAKRSGHFRGVCTIVSKFFHIVQPDRAYFGKKDIQQLYIIRQMVKDLNFGVEIIPCDIVREEDGLAMSSRNKYLSPGERKTALVLNHSIRAAIREILRGESSAQAIFNLVEQEIKEESGVKIDYISIVNEKLEPVEEIKQGDILAIAVFIGKTRLIDNHIVGEPVCF